MEKTNINLLISELKIFSPHISLDEDKNSIFRYSNNSLSKNGGGGIEVIIYPTSVEEIQKFVFLANKYSVMYTVTSIGGNIGYGSKMLTFRNGSYAALNLSKMKRIVDYNPFLGVVTLEPGVTCEELRLFLKKHESRFTVPVIGSGGSASVLGNIFDNGHSMTPPHRRKESLIAAQAVLPNGEVWNPYKKEGNRFFEKFGPFFEELFFQSSLGIVVKGTIQLSPLITYGESFFIEVTSDEQNVTLIECLRNMQMEFGLNIYSIRCINYEYFCYTSSETENLFLLPNKPQWIYMVCLGGNKRVIKEISKVLRKKIDNFPHHYISSENLNAHETLLKFISSIQTFIFLKSKIAFNVVFLKNCLNLSYPSFNFIKKLIAVKSDSNDAGLLLFNAVVPSIELAISSLMKETKNKCDLYNMVPLVSLAPVSAISYQLVVILVFDKNDEREISNANNCYDDLAETIKRYGGELSKVPVSKATHTKEHLSSFLYENLKNTLDSKHLFIKDGYE